ncbi:acetyl-CoA carboxylase [Nocardia coubleae]|uniref:Biotin carboxyl carrier protein of acetyl-CoA carboxylase n=1 Tax=Nocardia coubleae TaxID=356147 RepID=A0A846W2J4_9NOCA|nr:acetyl-CoA carboxylase [Nocardia coubleae]NKX86867.1 biotin carboxyl carrier domain-containing protein [Nocardia coubleae]
MSEHNIASPLPGVFYRSPAPGQPPFVEVGSPVSPGQTVGLVEIMKQFSEIKTETAGTLKSFRVDDYGTVAPGDVIAVVEGE